MFSPAINCGVFVVIFCRLKQKDGEKVPDIVNSRREAMTFLLCEKKYNFFEKNLNNQGLQMYNLIVWNFSLRCLDLEFL